MRWMRLFFFAGPVQCCCSSCLVFFFYFCCCYSVIGLLLPMRMIVVFRSAASRSHTLARTHTRTQTPTRTRAHSGRVFLLSTARLVAAPCPVDIKDVAILCLAWGRPPAATAGRNRSQSVWPLAGFLILGRLFSSCYHFCLLFYILQLTHLALFYMNN